jgi:hypothetical protein
VRLFAFLLLLPLAAASGQTFTSTGNGSWTNPANWSTGLVPTNGSTAVIASDIVADSTLTVTTMLVRVNSGTLTVSGHMPTGALLNNGGHIRISGMILFTGNGFGSGLTHNGGWTMVGGVVSNTAEAAQASGYRNVTFAGTGSLSGGSELQIAGGTSYGVIITNGLWATDETSAIVITRGRYLLLNSPINIRVGGTSTLTAAATVSGVNHTAGTMSTGGFSLTATALRLGGGTFVASNSTLFVSELTRSGGVLSQQTSTVSLLGGDNLVSNVPTLFNAVKYAPGTARITTNLAVTGTLEFQSGANLDGTGNIIGLANPATVGGNLQSGTITGNVLRLDGIADKASGQLNTPRQGRR